MCQDGKVQQNRGEMPKRHSITKEEKVAHKIGKELSDFTLDLDSIGFYLAQAQPYTILRRAIEVLESAEYNREQIEIGKQHERLWQ